MLQQISEAPPWPKPFPKNQKFSKKSFTFVKGLFALKPWITGGRGSSPEWRTEKPTISKLPKSLCTCVKG
jgi:hypothetical protein